MPPTFALDPEIAAADSIALERMRVQIYKNNAAHASEKQDEHVAAVKEHLGWVSAAHDALPPEAEEALKFKREFALGLALRYFTPVSTGDGTTDATNDAARFEVAMNAAIPVLVRLGLLPAPALPQQP